VFENVGKLGKDNLGISHRFSFSYNFDLLFMSLDPHISRRRRGLSPEINPIAEIGRRNVVLSSQQSTLRRNFSDSSSSSFSPLPIIHKMTSRGGSGDTRGASSCQPSISSVIGSLYSHQVPFQSTTNPAKVIKMYGLFHFEEDATTNPWHVSPPLNLAPSTCPLPKFKKHTPRFLGNNTVTMNENMVAFSNACHNIGSNDNDTWMCLFINSLEGKATTDFFDIPPKVLSTWEELVYWFKSTYGNSKSPTKQLREYNNIAYKEGETIKSFNLRFTKLYNQIPEIIHPLNQAAFMHYYNSLPLEIITNNGPTFISTKLTRFLAKLGVKHFTSSTYFPQGNGQAESTNKNLVRIIKRLIEDKPRQCHTLLTYTLWEDRTTTNVSTSCTPF
jgi:hypothetical protein